MQTKTQLEEIQNYLTDASNMQGGHATKLFIPESISDISEILRQANETKTPVTVSGARTGTVGGAIPFGGVVISLEKLNKIKSIDKQAMSAVVEPGVILVDFQKAVDAEGLFYPPDPTEWSCQMGGTVATNASGARSFKYGATRGFVQRLEIVLADGDTLTLSRLGDHASDDGLLTLTTNGGKSITTKIPTYERPDVRKNVSGYFNEHIPYAIDLFIGSEGTLGVVTEIELRLTRKPQGLFSGIVFFEHNEDLLAFISEAKALSFGSQSPILKSETPLFDEWYLHATLLEYFDDRSLKLISEKFPEVPDRMCGAIF
ncbi:MAG TPA: FAD-binding oxidoreductase, partial [Pyrinomonadaceae bacterium]|nr:FAD-binding oxidoreductase [Pyrinomonadaceae bacterium]